MQLAHNPETDPLTLTAKERQRLEIARQTEEFLARGGKIQHPANDSRAQEILHIKTNKNMTPATKKKLLAKMDKALVRANSTVS